MRKNKNGSPLMDLIRYCRSYIPIIVAALALACASAVMTLIGPNKLGDITNIITEGLMTGIDLKGVAQIAIFLVVLYLVSWGCGFSQNAIMANVTQRISKKLRKDLYHKTNRMPLNYFDTHIYGDVLSRITNDVDLIGQTLNMSIGTLVSSLTLFAGSLIMMLVTNWIMALAGVAATVVGFLFMMAIMRHSQKYFNMQQDELGRINGHVEEIYGGHTVVKAYCGENAARKEFHEMNDRLYISAWKSQFMSGIMQPLMLFIGNLGFVVVCVVGAALAINGRIEMGVIVSFMIYIRMFTQPLSQLAQVATSLQSTSAASERVFEFLGEEEMADETGKTGEIKEVKGDVVFDHVRFGYNEDRVIIKDFSAHAQPGQKIAIVGPTGAGKSTLVNLLMRFYEVNEGQIRIDGVPTSTMTREKVHENFCMVLQDTWIFEGTIRENIVYAKEGVTDEEVREACKEVGLDHFIQTLPDGYDTILDDSLNLSAGQKQLITIARAMIQDAPMLILDEATSSVDTRTEQLINDSMDKLMRGRTSFVIAHRLSTIRNADLILVLKDGDIIEQGNHDELMKLGGFYAELYNSQFEAA